jgi:hypothetical protein
MKAETPTHTAVSTPARSRPHGSRLNKQYTQKMKVALLLLVLPALAAAKCTPWPQSNKIWNCNSEGDCPDVMECNQWGDCLINCNSKGACSGKTINFSRDHVNSLHCAEGACVGTKVSLADRPKLGEKSCLKPGDTYGTNKIYCDGDASCKDMDVTLDNRCAGDSTAFAPNPYSPAGVAGSVPPSAIDGLKCKRCSSAPSWINGCPLPVDKTCGSKTCNCKWADKSSCTIHDGTECNTCCCGRYSGGSRGMGPSIGWIILSGAGGLIALAMIGFVFREARRRMRRTRGVAFVNMTTGASPGAYVPPMTGV